LAAPASPDDVHVLTPVVEAALGEKSLQEFLRQHTLSEDVALAQRVERVGRKVAAAGDRPNLTAVFYVVEGNELQAYSFPGGAVCVSTGLVRAMQDDDALAFALAHELAHVALRHHVAQLQTRWLGAGETEATQELLDVIVGRLGRASEIEADRHGALYAVRAGYRYKAAYNVLAALRTVPTPRQDVIHPEIDQRVAELHDFENEIGKCLRAFDQGVRDLQNGAYDDAVSNLTLFVAQFPGSLSGRVDLGAAYLGRARSRAGSPDGLAEPFPLLPDPGVTLRADSARSLSDVAQAAAHFDAALRLYADHPVALAGVGVVALRRGELDEARRLLNSARALDPGSADLALCRGNVDYVGGQPREAVVQYTQALQLRPGWWPALQNLALAYEAAGDTAGACGTWALVAKEPAREDLATQKRLLLTCGASSSPPVSPPQAARPGS
jgi:predicted Zn-dependent protease